jgi:thioesterase domain-containing protein
MTTEIIGAAQVFMVSDSTGDLAEPLVCLPPVSGSALWSISLARVIPGRPICAVQTPGVSDGRPAQTIPDLARRCLSALAESLPGPPRLLAGYSMGGILAFEMAHQLADAGQPPSLVALIDTEPPGQRPQSSEAWVLRRFVIDVASMLDVAVPDEQATAPLIARLAAVGQSLDADQVAALQALGELAGLMPHAVPVSFLTRRYQVFRAHMLALESYDPRPYPGPLELIRAAESADIQAQWQRYSASAVSEQVVPGNHYTMWSGANRDTTYRALANLVEPASSGTRPRRS